MFYVQYSFSYVIQDFKCARVVAVHEHIVIWPVGMLCGTREIQGDYKRND
jgi:hypothetical protein